MIRSDTFINPAPRFRVLSDSQCEQLFISTLDCLQQVGVQIHNSEARELLARGGAKVDDSIVFTPEWLVRHAIESVPPSFSVWGRDGNHEMRVAMDRVHFGPGPTCTHFIDPFSKEHRLARRGDAGLTAKVCDALPNIDYIMGLSFFSDVNPVLTSVYEFAEELANTTKPIIAWAGSPDNLCDIYQMAIAVAGSDGAFQEKPNFAFFTTYESPLRLADVPLANLIFSAEHGIPSICLGGPTVGLESPFTGASALVLYLASALAALTVVQLKRPGAPMAIGGLPSMMDLRTARPSYGAPETSLFSAAAADLARYLGLPFMGTAGASESKALDAQASAEATMGIIFSALSGASLVHDVGFLDCADIGSLGYLVLDARCAGGSSDYHA
jgi:trimethylamine--corrinoid protein Co-methyltransferase